LNRDKAILIIYTGGTIGMVHEPVSGALVPFNFDHILQQVPELRRFDFRIDTLTFSPLIDSSEITPDHWVKLSEIIAEKYHSYNGFVILHGTDTMAYTASALSFMLRNLYKPVILTGSQLPIGVLRTDGKENLITSAEIAASEISGKPAVPEVCIYFENRLYRGNRTTKLSAEHFKAFDSPNYPPLAEAGIDIKYNTDVILYPTVRQNLKVITDYSSDVAVLKLFPGITARLAERILETPGLKGVVLESYGAGNAPTQKDFIDKIASFCNRGGVVVNVTQCFRGSVNQSIYKTGRALTDAGVISGNDMTTEAAITKLMIVTGSVQARTDIERLMKKPICGEIAV
jgi:L-asparaginase